MPYSFFNFTLVLNSDLLSWKLQAFEFLLGASETLLCSVFAPPVTTAAPLHVPQLLMLFAGTLTYSEPNPFFIFIL
jgi:hypothetical protein